MSATAMGVSSAATGLREDSSCGANAVRAPEGFMGCGEPLSKTGDISTACKGGMKDQHKEIFRMPRILTNFENLATVKCCVIQESAPLDAFTAANMLNTQARKASLQYQQICSVNGQSKPPEAWRHGSAGQRSAALACVAPLPHCVRPG